MVWVGSTLRVAPWVHIRYYLCGYEKNIFNYHKKTIFPVDTSQGVTPKHNSKDTTQKTHNTQNSK